MASSTPAIRVPKQFQSIPHAGMSGGQAHAAHAATPRGGNPLRQAAGGGFDEEGHLLPPLGRPGTVSGIIGRMMDKADIAEFNAKQDVRNDAKQQKMQAGADAYWDAFQKSGNPDKALIDAVHPDSGGHVHLMDKDTFAGMSSIYSLIKQAHGAAEEPTDFSTKDVGNGYSVLTGPGMKPQVIKPEKAQNGHYMTDAQGNQFYTSHDNPTVAIPVMKQQGAASAAPEQMTGGKQAAVKSLSVQEGEHLTFQRQAALALTKMQNAAGTPWTLTGASGALGYGMIERAAALHTPLGAEQAAAYNQGYNELKASVAAAPGGSRLKAALEAKFATLPAPGQSNAFNVNQAIPAMRSMINMDMADLYTNLKGQHKPTDVAEENMNMVGITPEYMAQVKKAKFMLQTNPAGLDANDVKTLGNERRQSLTTGDENLRLFRQEDQLGLIPPQDKMQMMQKVPELANTPPNEVRPNPRPWMPPMPAMAPAGPAPQQQPQPMPQQQAPQPQDSQGAGAPIPPPQSAAPQAAPMPAPPQQAGGFNPIAAAQAAEMPGAAPVGQAQPQPEETASAGAQIPPSSPQESADIVSQHVDDVTKLIDSTRDLLQSTQVRPDAYSEQPDQLGFKKREETPAEEE